ncbi:MAG: cupredoxin domain-containing protein [Thaumarchaeota archaeon]|nr:cupredoxin domain-containing protein [Nitrososphaerota archaeon]
MQYESKPDRRLWALLILAAALIPGMITLELALPGFQPRFGASGSAPPPTSGGGKTTAVQVLMPNGVNFNHNLNFQPAQLVLIIGVNNTITWTNQDSADHTVTFTSGPSGADLPGLSDPDLGSGQTYTIALSASGTYQYHCSFHPAWMRGTIVVKSG